MDDTLANSTIRSILEGAILAPSSHNTQPWIFEILEGRVLLFADRSRALPVNDPEDRELTISCACALLNLRAMAAASGHAIRILRSAEPDSDLLAELDFDGTGDADLAPLAQHIPARRTYRKAFEEAKVDPTSVQQLCAAAEAEGAWLDIFEEPDRRSALGSLVSEADAELWGDPRWRRELAAWMHPRRSGDGLTLPWLALPAAKLVIRSFDMGGGVAAEDSALADASPVLAVLGTAGDTVADWMRAGQALQRLLLTAEELGLQASYLNQPVQVAAIRPHLANLCRHAGSPQIVLRLGHPGEDLPAAPRRPLDDVVTWPGMAD